MSHATEPMQAQREAERAEDAPAPAVEDVLGTPTPAGGYEEQQAALAPGAQPGLVDQQDALRPAAGKAEAKGPQKQKKWNWLRRKKKKASKKQVAKPKVEYPTVVTIKGEKVKVASEAEAKDAKRIITEMKDKYGITVDSSAGVKAIKKDYTDAPQGVRDGLKTKRWEYKELQALEKALKHFAPVLGGQRAKSSRSGKKQEVKTISKVAQGIDEDTEDGELDTTTMGEYFKSSGNLSLFKAGTDSTVDFEDNMKQLEGTAVHEMAHVMFGVKESNWAAKLAYWTDVDTKSGADGAEEPPTAYGKTNAGEDLAESTMMYFVAPGEMDACPERKKLLKGYVAEWTKKTPSKQKKTAKKAKRK